MATEELNVALLISTIIGYVIIAASFLLKVPQILKIVNAKSVYGLSFSMFILELIGYTISLAYSINSKFPFSTYGELFAITLQNMVIVYLLFSYTNNMSVFFAGAVAYVAVAFTLFGGIVPLHIQAMLQAATIPLFTISKLPQIWSNFQNKSVGQLSGITVFMLFGGSLARIFTTFTQVNDQIVLAGFIIGGALNGILMLQVIMYGSGTKGKQT